MSKTVNDREPQSSEDIYREVFRLADAAYEHAVFIPDDICGMIHRYASSEDQALGLDVIARLNTLLASASEATNEQG